MRGVRVVIFDFDYTLFDTSAGVVECMKRAFSASRLGEPTEEEIRQTIGLPLEQAITALAGPTAQVPEVARSFLDFSEKYMVDRTQPLEPAPEVLKVLRASGCRLTIVTGKHRARVERTLKKYELDWLFDHIVCGDEAPAKPNPEGLSRVMAAFADCEPASFVYVGDHPFDIDTARNAGIDCIAVATGKTAAAVLAARNPLRVIASLGELPGILLPR